MKQVGVNVRVRYTRRLMYVQRNMELRSRNHVAVEKQVVLDFISVGLYHCLVTLHANRIFSDTAL